MNLRKLRETGQLIAYIPLSISKSCGEFVLANNSGKWVNHPGRRLYEFVTWRLDLEGNCEHGHYFTGEDPMEMLANATRSLYERAGWTYGEVEPPMPDTLVAT